MKITIATGPTFPVPAVRGGAVQRMWEGLAREFAQRGHEVTIFAREFLGQAREEIVDGIHYVRRGGYEQSTSIRRDLALCLFYALKTARHVPPGDIVVTNDFWMPVILPWMKPSAGKVVPCLQRFPKGQGRLYGKCAALAAVSQVVADAVRAQSPSVAEKVFVVPNAIDEVFLEKSVERGARNREKSEETGDGGQETGCPPTHCRTTAGQAYGMRQTADGRKLVRILYVGRIHPEKGLGLLVQALNSMRHTADGRRQEADWECVLVGPVKESEGGGGEAFAEELKRGLEGLPVRFEAPVYDPAALARIYDEADVFVYPSVAESGESFGIAPLEAMARGVVPVVSDLAVFREYLEPGVNGKVFDHRSARAVENLSSAIGGLTCDANARRRMAVAGQETAGKFSTAAVAERYLKLFAETLQSGK